MDDARHQEDRQGQRHVEPMKDYHQDTVELLIPGQEPIDLVDASVPQSFYSHIPSFGSLFDPLFKNFKEQSQTKSEMAEGLTVVIALTPEQATRGGHVRLKVPVQLQCSGCKGRGSIRRYKCWKCSGAGLINGECPLIVSYPPGISDNHFVRLSFDQ